VVDGVLQILLAELYGVHADLVGQLVHQRLHGEVGLRVAGRAHRARGVLVRVYGVDLAVEVGRGVDVGLARLRAAAEAAEAVLRRPERDEAAVARGAGLELLPGAGAVSGEQELVLAREHQVDGGLRLLRELAGEHPLDADAELRAEAAAHVLDDGRDGALLQP
jgi:hypothetical protein